MYAYACSLHAYAYSKYTYAYSRAMYADPMHVHAYSCPENPIFVWFSFSFVFSHMFSLHLISFVLRLSSCLSVLSCFSLFISLMLVRVFYLFIYIDMDMI